MLTYVAATAVIMPIVEPQHVGWALNALPLAVPTAISAAVVAAWTWLTNLRNRNLFAFLCSHEIFNDVCSDVVAQAVTADKESGGILHLDWRRVGRSTSAG